MLFVYKLQYTPLALSLNRYKTVTRKCCIIYTVILFFFEDQYVIFSTRSQIYHTYVSTSLLETIMCPVISIVINIKYLIIGIIIIHFKCIFLIVETTNLLFTLIVHQYPIVNVHIIVDTTLYIY